jgi:hypothetical protein
VIGKAISGDDLGMGPFNSFEILVEGWGEGGRVDGQNGQKFRPRFYRRSATELISNGPPHSTR